ncbi:MAG TPA: S-adenosylmethionine:tRNA ribosyltransferase-isomerase [Stackebrandtia sp.]|jgi:S-adenosylmethionine:tRNA ribosyltransferase-isomerase|uniref:S-adenosylmethionine:tRNA ribosyltransferase-isomerase n=1 Tax=Stackebrandtia sp. TaxID=2023065 RepID=UPI002D73306B|nr:S-adenosylmethionine:tRNA ribosyltransferase-isomerase [Stackebrandtia sp.]HZE39804.1 S-adenosylmethionine:tRNA ribosyltransferase-isomerase [Stackebrandtia sp.]
MTALRDATFDFALDAALEATEPAEVCGRGRDDVRLLVTDRGTAATTHRRFADLPHLLRPGDLLVVNNSGTLPAAVWMDRLVVHFSTANADGAWLVELRERAGATHRPYSGGQPGEWLPLPGGATLELVRRHTGRLWVARLNVSVSIYLEQHGKPIRYSYVDRDWPLQTYQTVFATEPGSAEMPSAARPFTADTVTGLVSRGIGVAPITLHTGVASPEIGEPPYPERFSVPEYTARAVNAAHAAGGRVIAVGTTVVRALESAHSGRGVVTARRGVTDHIVTPDGGVHTVDGILTGLHEPRSTHLAMLSAFADSSALAEAYHAAIDHRYLWHEFGDVHLIA